jgi:hypothetical protein
MSIIIVAFEAAPVPSETAKQKEADLDSRIEAKVKGLCSLRSGCKAERHRNAVCLLCFRQFVVAGSLKVVSQIFKKSADA